MKFISSLLLMLIFLTKLSCQNPTWPFQNFVRGTITGTPGEIRPIEGDTNNNGDIRFHNGVDMINGANHDIYAIEDGIITWSPDAAPNSTNAWPARITVGNIIYKHIKIDHTTTTLPNGQIIRTPVFQAGQAITRGTYIGEMFNANSCPYHVHMQRDDNVNYFNTLTPFNDNVAPQIYDFGRNQFAGPTYVRQNNSHFARFYRNGITNDITTTEFTNRITLPLNNTNTEHTILYGRTDILSRVRDAGITNTGNDPGGNNNAPHRINYEIIQSGSSKSHGVIDAINFNTLLSEGINFPATAGNPANWVFANTSICCRKSDYILTTDFLGIVDQYWNTRLRNGVTENWQSDNTLNANANDNTEYSDGPYAVRIVAEDAGINQTEFREPVVIDNFMPYIKKIAIFIGGSFMLSKEWVFDQATGQIRYVESNGPPLPDADFSGFPLDIVITASEPLKSNSLVFTLTSPTGVLTTPQPVVNNINTEFTYSFNSNFTPGLSQYCAVIEGRDYANNPLLALQNMPGYDAVNKANSRITPVSRSQNGAWTPAPNTGADRVHCFTLDGCRIGPTPPPSTANRVSPPPGQCLLADFDFIAQYDGCAMSFRNKSLGNITQINWSFGDGTVLGGTVGNSTVFETPNHVYQKNGCYDVTLSIQDASGNTGSVTKSVCITLCGLPPGTPECQINGPTLAGAGASISLDGVVTGIGPFDYDWDTPSAVVFENTDKMNGVFTLDNDLNNGETFDIVLNVTDGGGYESSCSHTVTISGNIPSVDIAVFGSREVNQPLSIVALVDIRNIQYPEYYRFTVKSGNQVLINSGWLNGDWDYTLCYPGADNPTCLPPGIYQFCVDVRDDLGVYSDCKTINIGHYVEPPPKPAIELINAENLSTAGPIEITPDHPALIWFKEGAGYAFGNTNRDLDCRKPYYHITLKKIDPDGNETYLLYNSSSISQMREVKINGLSCSTPLYTLNSNNQIGLEIPYYLFECKAGTWKLVWEFRPADDFAGCCVGFEPTGGMIKDEITVNVRQSTPKVTAIEVEYPVNTCTQRLRAVAIGGCPQSSPGICGTKNYKKYDWQAYDADTGKKIIGLFSNNNDECVLIDPLHPFFSKFGPGEMARFKCSVTVWDKNDFTAEYSDLVVIQLPYKVYLPEEVVRCTGTTTPLTSSPLVVGNQGNCTYTWLSTGGVLDITTRGPEFPQVVIPASGGTWSATLRVTDDNGCSVTKTVAIKAQNLSVNVGSASVNICQSGAGIHNTIGPATVTGGTGRYTFIWSPGDHLRDPYVPNPEISFPQGVENANFFVTVTDDYGCSATAGPISVNGLYQYPTANAGADKTVCNRADGVRIGTNGSGNLQYVWTSDNPDFPGSNQAVINLTEDMNRKAGIWKYSVRAIEPVSGCYYEDVMLLTVRQPWQISGYESTISTAVSGTPVPLWQTFSSNQITGFVAPLTFSWQPQAPLTISNNSIGHPQNGTFIPTVAQPFLTLHASDGAGCFKDIKTNRYLLTNIPPSLNTIVEPDNIVCLSATDKTVIFDITFDAQAQSSNSNITQLPPFFYLNYALRPPQFGTPDKTGIIRMDLVNSTGLYKGRLEEKEYFKNLPSTGLSYPSSAYQFQVFTSGATETLWGSIHLSTQIYISNRKAFPPYTTCVINAGGTGTVFAAVTITLGVPECNYGTIMRDNGIIMAKSFIDIQPTANISLTGINSQNGPHLLINKCLEDPMQLADKQALTDSSYVESVSLVQERTIIKKQPTDSLLFQGNDLLNMTLYPNPFTGEIAVDYYFNGLENIEASLRVLDVMGQPLNVLFRNRAHQTGSYQTVFNGSNLPAGVYWFELTTKNGLKSVKKAVKTKI